MFKNIPCENQHLVLALARSGSLEQASLKYKQVVNIYTQIYINKHIQI